MTVPNYESETPDGDRLLAGITEALELTSDQRDKARRNYRKLGLWLSEPGSALAVYDPDVYAQGSVRIGTEVRPLTSAGGDACEHDLDVVSEFHANHGSAMQLFNALYQRLAANPQYRLHLVKKKRCVRINFPGDFHLDVLPARRDASRPHTTCIQIPDRELNGWTSSNPKAFALWFETRGFQARSEFERGVRDQALRKSVAPLPVPSYAERPVLTRVVQLLKRRRDIVFAGASVAPRSIVLTTLAAQSYDGEVSLSLALERVLREISTAIMGAMPSRLVVLNPTDPEEHFGDAWESDDVAYHSFVEFVHQFERDVRALNRTVGIEHTVRRLEDLFGETPARKSYRRFREEFRKAADEGQLYAQRARGLVVGTAAAAVRVPYSTHYGAAVVALEK